MNLLLDTHVLIWFAEGSRGLSLPARHALEHIESRLIFSLASIWELAIKLSLQKLSMTVPLEPDFRELLSDNGFESLPIEYEHLALVETLPFHHRDPFDRLLVAQAQCEGLTLVSADATLDRYGIRRLW